MKGKLHYCFKGRYALRFYALGLSGLSLKELNSVPY